MTRLDPQFAPAPAGYFGSPADLLEQIASLESDIDCMEQEIRYADREIPHLERERLIRQRDVATAKLKIIELQQKLEAKTEVR